MDREGEEPLTARLSGPTTGGPVIDPSEIGGGTATSGDMIRIESMTKAELLAFAEENGIEVDASMKKAEIIEAITG